MGGSIRKWSEEYEQNALNKYMKFSNKLIFNGRPFIAIMPPNYFLLYVWYDA